MTVYRNGKLVSDVGGGSGATPGAVSPIGRQILNSPKKVSISDASARNSVALSAGRYYIKVDATAAIRQGGSTVTAAWGTDEPYESGGWHGPFVVTGSGDQYFAAETGGATGIMWIKLEEAV
jgi:hypothetical protein